MFGSRRKPDPAVSRGGAAGDNNAAGSGGNVVTLPPRNAENVLRRLEWTVLRRLDGLLHGDYKTFLRGFAIPPGTVLP